MGVVKNVGFDTFPKQGKLLGKEVRVCFHYDTSKTLRGHVIRDDAEEPFRMLILLEDERAVLGTECMYADA